MTGDSGRTVVVARSGLAGVSDADLVREICALAAGIDRASARMLVLCGELDARSGWAWPGVMSMAHWVSWKLHISRHAASEQVRVARSLRGLPLMQAAFVDGRLSYSKVRALTRIATPSDEEDLVRLGVHATAAMIDRTVAAWRRCDAVDADPADRAARRRVSWSWDDDGMLRLSARLDAEEGAVVLAALQAVESARRTSDDGAGDAAESPTRATDRPTSSVAQVAEDQKSPRGLPGQSSPERQDDTEPTPLPSGDAAQSGADDAEKSPRGPSAPSSPERQEDCEPTPLPSGDAAQSGTDDAEKESPRGLLSSNVAAPSAVDPASAPPSSSVPGQSPRGLHREHGRGVDMLESRPVHAADALVALARAYLNGDGDTGRDPDTEMIVTVDSAVLTGGAGTAAYRTGGALTAEQTRRIGCDTKLVVVLAENSGVLDVSAASRTIPAPIRRALLVRDRGCCAMPACSENRPSRLHAHHVWHWADGGPTTLDNLVLVCKQHHRAIHEEGYRVTADGGRFTFTDPGGRVIPAIHRPAEDATAVPHVDPDTVPAWDGTPFDIDYVMAVLLSRRTWRRDQQVRLKTAHQLATAA